MTKKEALEKAQADHTPWFCPIINKLCNPRCYCYIPPNVHCFAGTYIPKVAYCIHRHMQE